MWLKLYTSSLNLKMQIKNLAVVAALVGAAVAAPAPSNYHVLHERRDLEGSWTSAWVKRSTVPVGRALPVRIGLQQSNLDIAHDLLMEV